MHSLFVSHFLKDVVLENTCKKAFQTSTVTVISRHFLALLDFHRKCSIFLASMSAGPTRVQEMQHDGC